MKFHTFAIVALLASKQVNSQTVTNGNFTFVGSYAFPSAKGAYLGGGSIVDDKLLLIVNAEEIDSYLGSVPVLRNCKLLALTHTFLLTYTYHHEKVTLFLASQKLLHVPLLLLQQYQHSYYGKDHWV